MHKCRLPHLCAFPCWTPRRVGSICAETNKIIYGKHAQKAGLKKGVLRCRYLTDTSEEEILDKPIRLPKTALKGRKINIPLPFTDFRPTIKQYVRKQWSEFWSLQSENKLHAVLPALECSVSSCREMRREEIVRCRLRIGHSFFILLAGENPPECISCQERPKVYHILLHFSEYHHKRTLLPSRDSERAAGEYFLG